MCGTQSLKRTLHYMIFPNASVRDSAPVRALTVVSGDLWAGAEVQVYQLLRAARRDPSVELHVVVLNPGILADRLVAEDIAVTVLDESRLGFRDLAREIRALARKWRPAVVHTHRRKEHFLGALAAQASGAGLVATVHGRTELPQGWNGLRQSVLRMLERTLLARLYCRLVAVSDELTEYLPGPAKRKMVIPNSVDVDAVRKAAMAAPAPAVTRGVIHIGFLGRLVPVKQVHHILEMMPVLASAYPERWALHIIGDGPLREVLERQAAQLRLHRAVTFHGFLPNPLPLLAQMDLLLFASAHEGLPMTALEALSLGVRIVSPPIGSLQRLIEESGAGAIARMARPGDLADAVMNLPLGERSAIGLRTALLPERYHIENGVRHTLELWREVVQDIHG